MLSAYDFSLISQGPVAATELRIASAEDQIAVRLRLTENTNT